MFAFFHFMDTCNISISYLAIFEMFSIAVDCLASKLSDYSWSLVERQRTVLWDMIRWSWKAKKTPAPTRKPNQIITNTHKKKTKPLKPTQTSKTWMWKGAGVCAKRTKVRNQESYRKEKYVEWVGLDYISSLKKMWATVMMKHSIFQRGISLYCSLNVNRELSWREASILSLIARPKFSDLFDI